MPDLMKVSDVCPLHRFERRQMTKRTARGTQVIAYVQVPQKDANGEVVTEEYNTPNGWKTRPVMVDDLNQPIETVFMCIRPHSSKDEYDMEAASFILQCEEQSVMAEMPLYRKDWADQYRTSYNNFMANIDAKLIGTDIMLWTDVSLAQRKLLASLGFVTVEQVATANEQGLMMIGTGGRAMKNQATDFLNRKEHIDGQELKATVATLQETVAKQAEMIEKLLAGMQKSADAVAEPAKSSTLSLKK